MIIPRYYENLHVLHENTMPDRAYYIPASKAMDSLVHNRDTSDRFQLLNGDWSFQYFCMDSSKEWGSRYYHVCQNKRRISGASPLWNQTLS